MRFLGLPARGARLALGFSIVLSALPLASASVAVAAPNSTNVAYVFDFGSGVSDPSFLGSNIFVNAITGSPPVGGNYTTPSGSVTKFTNVPVSTIDAGGLGAIAAFDTVMLYEVCDIGSHPNLVTALNSYLSTGLGKVVFYDGDRCDGSNGPVPNYSTFLFPFTSTNPGPRGSIQTLTNVEVESLPATITRGVAVGDGGGTDSVGDSNTFNSNTGGWCAAEQGTNALGTNGIQVGYVRTPSGGLAIYNGQDNWFTFSANAFNKKNFDNILDQPTKPDTLPCGVPVTGIKLDPISATNPVGSSHTVTATVTTSTGSPVPGVTVTFTVTSGPNAGKTGTAATNASGQATFTYSDTGGAGTDSLVATFTDSAGAVRSSNAATKVWTPATADTTPPSCALTAVIAGPPKQIQITIQDADGGLQSIEVITSDNANTLVPPFAVGTTDPVVVTATKIDQSAGAAVDLKATDLAGNVTTCDPALVTVKSGAGRATSQVVTGVSQAESRVSIYNNAPGVRQIDIKVNGKLFKATRLADGEVRTINVASGLTAGNHNRIVLTARGGSGSADVVISDIGKQTAAQHGTKHFVVEDSNAGD